MAPVWFVVRHGRDDAFRELVLGEKQNDQAVVLFRARFLSPVASTVNTRGRMSFSLLSPVDASTFRTLQDTYLVN